MRGFSGSPNNRISMLALILSHGILAFMVRAYEEIVEFIASGTTPDSVARFEPSQATKEYVADLIHKEKTVGLNSEEASELDHFLKLEHIMRLAKARARTISSQ